MSRIPKEPVKLVTVPSPNKIPERDIDKSPILECQHLGIDFGGLSAVKRARPPSLTCSPRCISPLGAPSCWMGWTHTT